MWSDDIFGLCHVSLYVCVWSTVVDLITLELEVLNIF